MYAPLDNFEKFFRAISYGVALSALFTLFASGSIGRFTALLFTLFAIVSWFLEETKWQLTERKGVIIIFLIIPLFYLDWKYNISDFNSRDAFTAGNLSRLILVLSSIKLLQKKSDRDWFLIYLIAFFEILLAAGVGISPLFIIGLLSYLLISFVSIIVFEIRKSARAVAETTKTQNRFTTLGDFRFHRLPFIALIILIAISFVAVPLFFTFPRVGGANFGGNLGGLSGFTGFSDSVRLGEIGRLQQSNEVVMRVKIENPDDTQIDYFRWRGVALDSFDNLSWKKSKVQFSEPTVRNDKDVFMLDNPKETSVRITQTIYLEPLDTPILFTLPRPLALQGNFQIVNRDSEGAISAFRSNWGRINYKAVSEVNSPNIKRLIEDNADYPTSVTRYLQLPENLDTRIFELSKKIGIENRAVSRFEKAKAIEDYLQTNYGYTLDLKASGKEPLADFLFNVREGHCEYFASSLAIMLRTQGIASRVVNGFQRGEYNETAGVYVVRQSDAHSWVEVYFPQEKIWVPFDATPAARQNPQSVAVFGSKLKSFIEGLETLWIQYVVSFDNQEQRSLFRSVRNNFSEFQGYLSIWLEYAKERLSIWWDEVGGKNGLEGSFKALAYGLAYVLLSIFAIISAVWIFRRIISLHLFEKLRLLFQRKKKATIVEFYERLQTILAKRGLNREPHQTPMEFAFASNMLQAISITEKYNQVRFGNQNLSQKESLEIENWLNELEEPQRK